MSLVDSIRIRSVPPRDRRGRRIFRVAVRAQPAWSDEHAGRFASASQPLPSDPASEAPEACRCPVEPHQPEGRFDPPGLPNRNRAASVASLTDPRRHAGQAARQSPGGALAEHRAREDDACARDAHQSARACLESTNITANFVIVGAPTGRTNLPRAAGPVEAPPPPRPAGSWLVPVFRAFVGDIQELDRECEHISQVDSDGAFGFRRWMRRAAGRVRIGRSKTGTIARNAKQNRHACA